MKRIRVIDLETTGASPPAHDVCEVGWQDVVEAEDGRWVIDEERGALFVNPRRPIPPMTMAVHHIVDDDVAGAPFWRDVAPSILRPTDGVVALAAHRASFEQRFCVPSLSGGARWICTWKCALRLWPDSPGFSNQMLRYWRMPEGLDRATGLPAHRALPDAYVTAHHLRDMVNISGVDQLMAWSDEPGLLPACRPDLIAAATGRNSTRRLSTDLLRIAIRISDIRRRPNFVPAHRRPRRHHCRPCRAACSNCYQFVSFGTCFPAGGT